MYKKFLVTVFVLLIFCLNVFTQDRVPARDKFDWKAFDTQSTIDMDSINYESLQGNWIAHQGSHISKYEIGWSTGDRPKTLQIKGQKYRKTLAGPFYPFKVKKNLIIFYTGDQPDSAYVSLITNTALTISFKSGRDYDQYEYKK